MRLLLQILSLNDRYERKARLLPGLLVAAVPTAVAAAVLADFTSWYATAGVAAGAELLAAFVLGHLARARGRTLEEELWGAWGGPPTTRWLRPDDTTCSEQQKARWRVAIKHLTGIAVPASCGPNRTAQEVDRVITDAVRQMRHDLRQHPQAGMVQTHNEEYGFARNLCGLRWHAVALAALSLAACGALFLAGQRPWAGLAVSLVMAAVSLLLAFELPAYVRRCADRYAESLFAAAARIASDQQTPQTPSPAATSGSAS